MASGGKGGGCKGRNPLLTCTTAPHVPTLNSPQVHNSADSWVEDFSIAFGGTPYGAVGLQVSLEPEAVQLVLAPGQTVPLLARLSLSNGADASMAKAADLDACVRFKLTIEATLRLGGGVFGAGRVERMRTGLIISPATSLASSLANTVSSSLATSEPDHQPTH